MYVSARETSTIIALDGALEAGTQTQVRWMIGVPELWEGTGFEDTFQAAEGEPTANAGQHSVIRIDDPELEDGQFYLEMFNNNFWNLSTRNEPEWIDLQPAESSLEWLRARPATCCAASSMSARGPTARTTAPTCPILGRLQRSPPGRRHYPGRLRRRLRAGRGVQRARGRRDGARQLPLRRPQLRVPGVQEHLRGVLVRAGVRGGARTGGRWGGDRMPLTAPVGCSLERPVR